LINLDNYQFIFRIIAIIIIFAFCSSYLSCVTFLVLWLQLSLLVVIPIASMVTTSILAFKAFVILAIATLALVSVPTASIIYFHLTSRPIVVLFIVLAFNPFYYCYCLI
jgi:hypothetical protein